MPRPSCDLTPITEYLREALPSLQAVYLFGSQARGEATTISDVDLAVLLPTPLPAHRGWLLSSELADRLETGVDLIDLRQASTILQHQVITEGRRLWSRGLESDEFELMVQSEYWDLCIQREPLIADIKQRGSIYGR